MHLKTFEDAGKFNLSVTNQSAASPVKLNYIQKLFKAGTDWQPGKNGMGLGLILIRDFAEKMNGTMEVQTECGMLPVRRQYKKNILDFLNTIRQV